VVLRAPVPADAPVVAEYHHRCWVLAFSSLFEPGVVAGLDPRRRLWLFELWFAPDQDEVTTVVAEVDGTVVGHATVGGKEVIHLFVDPDHWGRGIGRMLLAEAERRLAAAGVAQAELHTMVGNAPAIELYERAGWTLTDRIVHSEVEDVAYDEHVLTKDLARQ
jgi:ribosomal protein S18 acetylase RimI-like enzyme